MEHHALLEVHLLGQRLKRGVDVGSRPLIHALERDLGGIQNGAHAFLGQTLVDRLLVILERLGRGKDGGGDGHGVGRHLGARLDDGGKRVDPVLAVLDVTLDHAGLVQLGDHDLVGKLGVGHVVDILGIDPVELFGVEGRRVLGNAVERELTGQNIARDDRGLAVERPAEQRQVVNERVGQVAGVAVLLHRGGAVAFGELLAVGTQDHGDVGERGNGGAEGLVNHDLARGVGQMVVAADDMGDLHHGVVDDGREVIRGRAIGAEDDEVVELLGVEGHLAVDGVVDDDIAAVLGHLDAKDVGLAGLDAAACLLGIEIATAALIALEGVFTLLGGLTVGLELLLGAEAGIGLALVPKLLGGLLVQVQALGLGIGAKVAANLGTLVPVQAQPTHSAQNDLRVLVGRAGGIGVVDAQDERAAVCAGKSPVIDSGAGAADVQLARR